MQRHLLALVISLAVLFVSASRTAGAASNTPSSSLKTNESLLKSFLRARCGPSGAGVWVYRGTLVDPLNGNEIAQVQGVELVRCLAVTDPSSAQRERYQRRCGDLACASAIGGLSATAVSSSSSSKAAETSAQQQQQAPSFEYAGTLLSRKLFCYTNPSSNNSLLRKIRLRPTSPERTIPLSQAATVYDTATTFCQYSTAAQQDDSKKPSNAPPLLHYWLVHTEHPDGRTISGTTPVVVASDGDVLTSMSSSSSPSQPKKLEFTVYAKPQPLWRQRLDLTRLLQAPPPSTTSNSNTPVVVSPQRRRWIQFGSSTNDEVGKFGARETYQYTMLNQQTSKPSCFVRYTRYGEAPLWYGPGRLCTLELTGKRIENWNEVPPLVAKVAYERVVGFLSVNSPVPQDDTLARRAVEWFRGKGSAKLQIAPVDTQDESSTTQGLWKSAQGKASHWWNHWRSATSMNTSQSMNARKSSGR